jgi:hypothetical protein
VARGRASIQAKTSSERQATIAGPSRRAAGNVPLSIARKTVLSLSPVFWHTVLMRHSSNDSGIGQPFMAEKYHQAKPARKPYRRRELRLLNPAAHTGRHAPQNSGGSGGNLPNFRATNELLRLMI